MPIGRGEEVSGGGAGEMSFVIAVQTNEDRFDPLMKYLGCS